MVYDTGDRDRRLVSLMYERQPTTAEALTAFFDDLELTASPATLKTYHALLRNLPELDALDARALITDRFRRQSPSTARTFRAALMAFCAWCVEHKALPSNPVTEIPRPRGPSAEPKVLTKAQTRALWLACQDDKDRLLLLLLGTGLRRAEVVNLRRQDVQKDGTARILGKGRKTRYIVLPAPAMALLAQGVVLDLTASALFQRIKAMGKRAGVPWVHPHALRHTFATNWMLETQDMETLRTLGGWSDTSPMPRHYARRALQESALIKARKVDLDLFGE